jgi:hypothetical protein
MTVARCVEQGARRSDRTAGMLVVGERRDEDPDDLVADELVDDAVMGDEDRAATS